MSQDASIPRSDLICHIYQIQQIAALITSQSTHGVYATNAQPFTSQLVDANMTLTSIPLSDFIHHIRQIQYIATFIMSQYANGVYNTHPFPSQLDDTSMMSLYYDPCEAH